VRTGLFSPATRDKIRERQLERRHPLRKGRESTGMRSGRINRPWKCRKTRCEGSWNVPRNQLLVMILAASRILRAGDGLRGRSEGYLNRPWNQRRQRGSLAPLNELDRHKKRQAGRTLQRGRANSSRPANLSARRSQKQPSQLQNRWRQSRRLVDGGTSSRSTRPQSEGHTNDCITAS
jgi:hypothetical protein